MKVSNYNCIGVKSEKKLLLLLFYFLVMVVVAFVLYSFCLRVYPMSGEFFYIIG